MATITTDTFLDGGTARTAGEAWTIKGGLLTVRTDTRWHANAPASMTGSLGSQTISATLGGGVLLEGRNVRWMPYNSGSGNVPAIGTTITQGGVSGYLLGVWASLTSAPTAVGAAMPATGFIKLREVTGGPYAAGALTGIGASATGPDVRGWIEVVMDQSTAVTVPRKGSGHLARGDWFYLDNTTGSLGQVLQTPTNGGGATTQCPGVWVETGVGTDEYEFWPALSGASNGWAVRELNSPSGGTDVRQQFVKDLGSGQMQFGEAFTSAALTYGITSSAVTYTWSGNTVTVTLTSHGYSVGEQVHLDFTSGGATGSDGVYTVATVTSANAFTVALTGSGASGAATLRGRVTITYGLQPFAVGNKVYVATTTGDLASGTYEITSTAAGAITINATPAGGTGGNCTVQQTIGHVPSAGRRTRIPNIILRQCTTGARATNAFPTGTIQNRPDFVTTGAGVVDHEYTWGDWYYLTSQSYKTRLVHVATFDAVNISEAATDVELIDGGTGMVASLDAPALSLTSNFAGGTITDWHAPRGNAPGTSDHACAVATCTGLTFTRGRYGIVQYPRSSGVAISLSQSSQITLNDVAVLNQGLSLSTATNITVNNLDYSDRYIGVTNTGALSAITATAKSADVVIDGVTFGLGGQVPRVHPYTSILSVTACDRITMRNIGTRTAPATPVDHGVNVMNSIWSSGGNNADIKVKRCYVGMARSGTSTTVNSDKNVLEESVFAQRLNTNLSTTFTPSALNMRSRGCGAGTASTSANASVYGTHFYDLFTAFTGTLGRVVLVMNEPTEETASQVTVTAGTPQFTSVPSLSMPTVGDQVIIEMDYFALGHTGLSNQLLTGTNTGNMSYEYQIDLGSGYSGTWLTLNGTNLSSHTLDPAVGFRLKYRITTVTANTGNAVTHIQVITSSTEAAQTDNLYPLDPTIATFAMSGLQDGTEVRVYRADTEVEVAGVESTSGGAFSYTYNYEVDIPIFVVVHALGWLPIRYEGLTLSNTSQSIPVQQTVDRQYLNPA